MRRGPKSTPTALLVHEGGRRKGGILANEPKPESNAPPMPPFLSGYAQEEWLFILPQLARLGILAVVDKAAIGAYCAAYGRWRLAEEKFLEFQRLNPHDATGGMMIRTKGGNAIQNPLLSLANRAQRDIIRAAAELGLTPASRAQLSADSDPDDEISRKYGI